MLFFDDYRFFRLHGTSSLRLMQSAFLYLHCHTERFFDLLSIPLHILLKDMFRFPDKLNRAQIQCCKDCIGILSCTEYNKWSNNTCFLRLFDQGQTIHLWHIDIRHNNVNIVLLRQICITFLSIRRKICNCKSINMVYYIRHDSSHECRVIY